MKKKVFELFQNLPKSFDQNKTKSKKQEDYLENI